MKEAREASWDEFIFEVDIYFGVGLHSHVFRVHDSQVFHMLSCRFFGNRRGHEPGHLVTTENRGRYSAEC